MVKTFVKKPIQVQAIQWTGDNYEELVDFVGNVMFPYSFKDEVIIETLEGEVIASRSDWIIRGIDGKFYLCDPDIFEKTYEEVKNND